MRKPVLVFGAGGHAKVIIDLIEQQGLYDIIGVIDRSQGVFCGYPVFGDESELPSISVRLGVIAIGDNWVRGKVAAKVRRLVPEFEFATLVHPSAQIAREVALGPGTVVLAGACINRGTQVGSHCIVNTRASIDHDSSVGDYVSLAPGVACGGGVRIGEYSMLGIGASVIHDITIGSHTVVGAGAAVVDGLGSSIVAYGVPCRTIRDRKVGEKCL